MTYQRHPICPYCSKPAELVTGAAVYPNRRDLHALFFWRCEPCRAYVGCHKAGAYFYVGSERIDSDGTMPLGRLANAELRRAKAAAHDAFDPIWRGGAVKRRKAYKWLARQLGIHPDDCHIGNFDLQLCRQTVAVASAWRGQA